MSRSGSLLVLCLVGLLAGCASSGVTPRPFPVPSAGSDPGGTRDRGTPPEAGLRASAGYAVAGAALSLRGAPYKNGGADPSGFDCSGLVQYVFARQGISVPRTVTAQYRAGHAISPDDLEPGDLVFFTTVAPGATHVGIAIGGDEFVHAPSSKGEVRVEHLSAPYWASRFVGARRDW